MELELGSTASLGRPDLRVSIARLVRFVVVSVSWLLFLLATMLLARRLAGALVRPLDSATLIMTGALLACTAAIVRLAWRRLPVSCRTTVRTWLVCLLPASALLGCAIALSLPATPPWSLGAFWTLLVVEEGVSLGLMRRRRARRAELPGDVITDEIGPPEMSAELTAVDSVPASSSFGRSTVADREVRIDPPQQPSPHFLPPNATQQLTRAEEDGSDVLYGVLRGHFAPGQRSLRLHVSFCPPFDAVPEVTVDKLDGPEVTVKPAQVLAYGIRLDLRLKAMSAESHDVVLELFVRGARSEGE